MKKVKRDISKQLSKRIVNKFESLPIELQKLVLKYIDFLQKGYESKRKKRREWKPIKNMKFVGIWENRGDVNDSNMWIRNLRKKEWREI